MTISGLPIIVEIYKYLLLKNYDSKIISNVNIFKIKNTESFTNKNNLVFQNNERFTNNLYLFLEGGFLKFTLI